MPEGKSNMPILLLPKETEEVLRVCSQTLRRWRRAGMLVPVRLPGGRYRYRRADVLALLGEVVR